MTTAPDWNLDESERDRVDRDGYVVRSGVFTRAECDAIARRCEELLIDLVENRRGEGSRFAAGSYVFDPDFERGVMMKWEGDSDVIHGVEPFAHLSAPLSAAAHDERFLAPMRHLVGHPEPMLFTEKLNLKRAGVGGPNPLHCDFPYWRDVTPRADEIATSILFLDDATEMNGCLEVVPGSHRGGEWAGREGDYFAANEIDTDQLDLDEIDIVTLEVEAGSTVSFGSRLVHRSAPNRSDVDRRALLFSYQPPIEPCPTQLEVFLRLAPTAT
jgi:ectoine hydroxylase-related dioxygenase (phytanoyl-CoA dioxygenase family)